LQVFTPVHKLDTLSLPETRGLLHHFGLAMTLWVGHLFFLNRTSTRFLVQSDEVVMAIGSERGMLFKSTS